ncbi:MAG: hypothetical protein AB7G21_10025 [Dehalococcoidia bacterium]
MDTATVHLHRGFGPRLGTLTSVSGVNRVWNLMQTSPGAVTVALDDPLVLECDPRAGNAVVIESPAYPHPWVGAITRLDRSKRDGTARLTLVSAEAVLQHRYLPSTSDYTAQQRTAAAVFADIIQTINLANDSEVGIDDDLDQGPIYAGAFPDRSALGALNAVAQASGMEWGVSYQVDERRIVATASIRTALGENRTATVFEDGTEGVETLEDAIDMGGAPWLLHLVGGQADVLDAYTERSRSARRQGAAYPVTGAGEAPRALIHGFAIEHAARAGSPFTRTEALYVAEELKSAGAVDAAAAALAGRPRWAERILRLSIGAQHEERWRDCDLGSVVRFRSTDAFLTGCDVPVRIVSVQPTEEAGELIFTAQVLEG